MLVLAGTAQRRSTPGGDGVKDYLLRTATEKQMRDTLVAAGVAKKVSRFGTEMIVPNHTVAIDEIGQIEEVIGNDESLVQQKDTRWHVNLRAMVDLTPAQVAALPTFSPLPRTPVRGFA